MHYTQKQRITLIALIFCVAGSLHAAEARQRVTKCKWLHILRAFACISPIAFVKGTEFIGSPAAHEAQNAFNNGLLACNSIHAHIEGLSMLGQIFYPHNSHGAFIGATAGLHVSSYNPSCIGVLNQNPTPANLAASAAGCFCGLLNHDSLTTLIATVAKK